PSRIPSAVSSSSVPAGPPRRCAPAPCCSSTSAPSTAATAARRSGCPTRSWTKASTRWRPPISTARSAPVSGWARRSKASAHASVQTASRGCCRPIHTASWKASPLTPEPDATPSTEPLLPVRAAGRLTSARRWQLLGSVAVSALFTWWAFRDTAWSAQWQSLRSADHRWIWPHLGVLLAIHLCRTLRWGALLSGLEKVPFRPLNEASAIGFMLTLVLPFRLGEFARPLLIAHRTSIGRSAAMTTVVLERIVDGLLVATLLRVMLWVVPIE